MEPQAVGYGSGERMTSNVDEYSIRDAVPDDAEAVAYLMYLAGKGHVERSVYDLLIDGPEGPTRSRLQRIERLFTAELPSLFQHSIFRVVESDGRPLAALCTFNGDHQAFRGLYEALSGAGWSAAEIKAMGKRMKPFFRCNPDVPPDTWIIDDVATMPGFRRRGLMDALLRDAIRRGNAEGFTRMQISCFIGNKPARLAYEKAGFRVAGQRRHESFEKAFGCPGMYRLTRTM